MKKTNSNDVIDPEADYEFGEWLKCIRFVDKNGKLLPQELLDDDSDDPEGDRG